MSKKERDDFQRGRESMHSEMEALRAENEALAHVVELCRASIGHNAKCTCPGPGEFVGMREGDNPKCMRCIAAAALLSTPSADLDARLAKEREPLERRIRDLEGSIAYWKHAFTDDGLTEHDARVRREALSRACDRLRPMISGLRPEAALALLEAVLGPESQSNEQETK